MRIDSVITTPFVSTSSISSPASIVSMLASQALSAQQSETKHTHRTYSLVGDVSKLPSSELINTFGERASEWHEKKIQEIESYLPLRFKDKKDVLDAVAKNGLLLRYVSEKLQDDEEVVNAAVLQNGLALEYASSQWKKDKRMVLRALKNDGRAYSHIEDDDLKRDPEVMRAAVKENGWVFFDLPSKFRNKEMALIAVAENGLVLERLDEAFRDDEEIAIAAINQNPLTYKYISKRLKQQKHIILFAVSLYGPVLAVAEEWQNNKEVVLEAVREDGWAIKRASLALQKDKDVLAAKRMRSERNNDHAFYVPIKRQHTRLRTSQENAWDWKHHQIAEQRFRFDEMIKVLEDPKTPPGIYVFQ